MTARVEKMPLTERLADKFSFDPDGCWRWHGYVDEDGYGRLKIDGAAVGAHVAVYELVHGAVPAGLTLDHLCRVTRCVNPGHLEVVTRGANVLRGDGPAAVNARKSVCSRGHDLSRDADVYVTKDGRRDCRACRRERRRLVTVSAQAQSSS